MVGDAKFSEAQDFSGLKLWSGFFFLGGGKLFVILIAVFVFFLSFGDPPGDSCWAFCPNPG